MPAGLVLDAAEWRAAAARHAAEVDGLTAAHRSRASRHEPHPVEDFLFTYYTLRPAQLRRWYPEPGTVLLDAGERGGWRGHETVLTAHGPGVRADVAGLTSERADTLRFVRRLLANTRDAAPQFGCFGLHEWAMVYRDERRHGDWPLRLGADGTDAVVEGHRIRCTHHDAYRFFTPAARGRNLLHPTAATRDTMEQPGCLHAGMDLYKWAYKALPLVSSDLLLRCFRLARDIRELDMRASPYDLRALGYTPVRIETAEGKSEYTAAQRDFTDRGQALRAELLAVLPDPDGPAF